MARSRQLFRDFGLTLVLLLVAALVFWRTTLPALRKGARLDDEQQRMFAEQEQLREKLERMKAAELAGDDPEHIERLQRDHYGAAGLPGNEVLIEPDAGEAATAATSSPNAGDR